MIDSRLLKTISLVTLVLFTWSTAAADLAFANTPPGGAHERGKTDETLREQDREDTKSREKEKSVSRTNVIEKEKKGKNKRWVIWVIAGAIVVGVALLLLLKKKKKEKEYTLTVELDEGVEGRPRVTDSYPENTEVPYDYRLKAGYGNLVIKLDGVEKEVVDGFGSGSVPMDGDHKLEVETDPNDVQFEIDPGTCEVEVPEGGAAEFKVRLSSQPKTDISAAVGRSSGDTDINVSGSGILTFTTGNFHTFQTVTLQANEDPDLENGRAIIRIEAAGTGIEAVDITAVERENDSEDLPPEVSITNPSRGGTVNGIVTIRANADDDRGIRNVEFYVDNGKVGADGSEPFDCEWDSKRVSDGSHTIKVIAHDTGDQSAEDQLTVNVNNIDDPPRVSIESPGKNEIVRGHVAIQAEALDDFGIRRLELYIDGEQVHSYTPPPYPLSYLYKCDWDTTKYPNATHFIKVVVSDSANQKDEKEIMVTVSN